jgi:predicted AAA+ superfamily ATPase
VNFLRGNTNFKEGGVEFGKAFEQFIAMELRAWLSYRRLREPLRYWRTQAGSEVDFLIGEDIAIEVKAIRTVSDNHLKGLRVLNPYRTCHTDGKRR